MQPAEFCHSLRGVFGFPVTPFGRDLSVDLEALSRNVDDMSSYPFCALVVAGGMGEFHSLTADEVERVVRAAVQAVSGRMPVICGVASAEVARRAERAGAAGLLVFPPLYADAPEEGLTLYYEMIGRATALPLILYSRDWARFRPDQVLRICERVPRLTGWKDGQADLRLLHRIRAAVGDRLAWYGGLGDDYVTEYRALGLQAYTSSLSNFAPQIALDLWTAHDPTALLESFVSPIWAIRERMRGYEVAVTKSAMELMGRTAGPVRPPLANMRPADVADLRDLLQRYR